jgi:hypothetical protein
MKTSRNAAPAEKRHAIGATWERADVSLAGKRYAEKRGSAARIRSIARSIVVSEAA